MSRLRLSDRPREQLPLTRTRFSATARLVRRLRPATVHVEARVYDDTWRVVAFSGDVRCPVELTARWSLGPHARGYVQSGASFWKLAYVATGAAVPAIRTGDRELGPLMNLTGGATLQWRAGPRSDPDAWVFGLHADVTYTGFFADLYVSDRLAAIASFTTEAQW